jgi:tRNA U34 2-thiouridine synthase MnmA/TrmU
VKKAWASALWVKSGNSLSFYVCPLNALCNILILNFCWIAHYLPPNSGCIVNLSTGECIGKHQGLWSITIGQGARLPSMAEKMYFAQKDVATNTAFVVPGV